MINEKQITRAFDQRDFSRGFLPNPDPLTRLPSAFDEWEDVAADLSKLALSRYIRPTVQALPRFPTEALKSTREMERAVSLLSMMGNLYVFAPDHPIATSLPKSLAVGWYEAGQRLMRLPTLTYASQVLNNWRRHDPNGPLNVSNLTMIQNFLGGMDEEWFAMIHVQIEAESGRALQRLQPAQEAVVQDDVSTLESCLIEMAETLNTMRSVLARMPERCEPDIYYHRVRPYMFGWYANPLLPDGMIYEGVDAYGGQPQQFRGETGAQSSVIYCFDAVLGVAHEYDEMRAYLMEMRYYMPTQDRAFIEHLEMGPSVRDFVLTRAGSHPTLRDTYNTCLERLQAFRQLHIEYAAMYVLKPGQKDSQGEVGTGGTPFTVYLKKHIRETNAHRI
ncbi:MAG: hypothetical protein AAF702_13215 [Chloroflexota bacterium]